VAIRASNRRPNRQEQIPKEERGTRVKAIGAGIVLIVAGIWVRAHYAPIASLCRSGLGDFAQALSSTAHQNCSAAETAVTLSPWAIGLGAVLVAGSIVLLLGLMGTAAATARRKRSTAPQGDARRPDVRS
jgi:hypothetical protein